MYFGNTEDYKTCPKCGYRFYTKPMPKVCPNPKCLQPIEFSNYFEEHLSLKIQLQEKDRTELKSTDNVSKIADAQVKPPITQKEKPEHINEIQVSSATPSKKIAGVRIKQKDSSINLDEKIVVFPNLGIYFKNFGIITSNRTILYNRNEDFSYICELSVNLDYIASSILGGVIDKLTLQSEISLSIENILYLKQNNIIFFVYGVFPNKQGNFILNEMKNYLKDLIQNKDPDTLDKVEIYNIYNKMNLKIKFILNQFINMTEFISEKEIPIIDDWIKIYYIGMSYQSVGVISLLLGNDLDIETPKGFEHPTRDLIETLITAKIEAIAANTIANTKAVPKYLTVKLGYEKYRYIIFNTLKNDYIYYMLAEGNFKKVDLILDKLNQILEPSTNKPFDGDLLPFQNIKNKLMNFFFPSSDKDSRIFT